MGKHPVCRRHPALWGSGVALSLCSLFGSVSMAHADPISAVDRAGFGGSFNNFSSTDSAFSIGQIGAASQDAVTLDRVLDVLQQAGSDTNGTQYGMQVSTVALQLALLLSHYMDAVEELTQGFTDISGDYRTVVAYSVDDADNADNTGNAEPRVEVATFGGENAELLDDELDDLLTEVVINGRTIDLAGATWDDVTQVAVYLASLMSPDNLSGAAVSITLPGLPEAEEVTGYSSLSELVTNLVGKYGKSTDGYANGYLPKDVLCPLDFAVGHWSRCDAAGALIALNEDFKAQFGYDLPIGSSYRPFETQVQLAITKPHLAANPGYSMHGWGLAIDFGGVISKGLSAEYDWLLKNAPTYGWENPPWAQLDGSKPEPWHFEFMSTTKPAGYGMPVITDINLTTDNVGDEATTWAPAAAESGENSPSAAPSPTPTNNGPTTPAAVPEAPKPTPSAVPSEPATPSEPESSAVVPEATPEPEVNIRDLVCHAFYEGQAYGGNGDLQGLVDELIGGGAGSWDCGTIIRVLQEHGFFADLG